MPRKSTPDSTIGARIKTRRELRDWSIRHAADRAGIAHSTWSRIERGLMAADNRFLVADIAAALECPVTELTGAPVPTRDRDSRTAQDSVYAILQALLETDPAEPSTVTARPLPALERETALVRDLRARCDYAGAGPRLPALLRELHAAASGLDRATAYRLAIDATYVASSVLKYLGHPAEAWLAAERCREVADALEDPVLQGVAAFTRAHAATACGAYPRALGIATRAVDGLNGKTSAPGGLEMLGMLQLTCAFANRGLRRPDDSAAWIAEAEAMARRTGDTSTLDMQFGPTNVNFWRISMETDGGDPARAVRIAQETNPARIGTTSRQVAFYTDTAKALSRVRKDQDAIRYLLTAERLAPVRVRSSALAQETARALLERSRRRAGGTELRGLCERMGLDA